jgi:hypothetical protein
MKQRKQGDRRMQWFFALNIILKVIPGFTRYFQLQIINEPSMMGIGIPISA